jgi:predicted glycoside hydrolase/deacetylase ChbG (UPF0249 family)
VNADDLGLSPGVNAGIFEGFDRGVVTSTSLMAGGEEFDAAVRGLRARPRLDCGVHLVLHDERPVAPEASVPSLLGPDGKMHPLGTAVRRLLSGRVPAAEIETEYRAQIERVLAAGIRPSHLDSHCHLHGVPAAGAVLHRLGREYGIPWARRSEFSGLAEFLHAPVSRYPVSILISAMHRISVARIREPLRMPDRLLGLLRSGMVDAAWLSRAVLSLRDGELCEIVVHPGDGTGPGDPDGDHGPNARKRELQAVTSGEVRAAVERRGVRLVTYAELGAP